MLGNIKILFVLTFFLSSCVKLKIQDFTSKGLILYYPLNIDIKDYSRNNLKGFLYGNASFSGDSIHGKALYFDGVDDYIDVLNDKILNPTNQISLCAWIKPIDFRGIGNNTIIDKAYFSHEYPFYQYHLGITGNLYPNYTGNFVFDLALDNNRYYILSDPFAYRSNEWVHIVGTFDGTQMKMFINGNLFKSIKVSGKMKDFGSNLKIAKFNNIDSYTPGTLCNIRIYERALSEKEILILYKSKL